MNRYAIFHRPESCYAYAVAADTLAVVLRTARGDRFDEVEILYNNKYDFTKRRQAKAMERCATDGLYAYYLSLIHLSEPTRRTPFSYAVFCLQKKTRDCHRLCCRASLCSGRATSLLVSHLWVLVSVWVGG